MTTALIAQLKVTLDDVEPKVIRRLSIPLKIRLDRLHLTLQAAMGWTNTHLWEFRVRDIGWGPKPDYDDFGDGPLDAAKTTLGDVLEDTGAKTIRYLYDFGDGWEHVIKIEKITAPVPGLAYPVLLMATGQCPPEDVGGPFGYAEFLEAIADPNHEEHGALRRWYGGDFDPDDVDTEAIDAELQRLAKRWTRKPPARRRKSA